MGLLDRIDARTRADVEREHHDTRGAHDRPECPLCRRQPIWTRNIRAKDMTRR